MLASGALAGGVGLLQKFGLLPMLRSQRWADWHRGQSTFTDPSAAGVAVVLLATPLLAGAAAGSRVRRFASAAAGAALLVVLADSGSRAGLVGTITAVLVFVLWGLTRLAAGEGGGTRRRVVATIGTLAILGALALAAALSWPRGRSALSGRVEALRRRAPAPFEETLRRVRLYEAGWSLFREHPVAGLGLGSFRLAFPEVAAGYLGHPIKTTDHPPSLYLGTLAESGLAGASLLALLLLGLARGAGRALGLATGHGPGPLGDAAAAASVIGLFVVFLFGSHLLYPEIAAWVAVLTSRLPVREDGRTARLMTGLVPVVLAGALVCALGGVLARSFETRAPDAAFHYAPDAGVWATETEPDGRLFRWTSRAAAWRVPGGPSPFTAVLPVKNARPDGRSVALEIWVDDVPRGRVTLPAGPWRRLEVPMAEAPRPRAAPARRGDVPPARRRRPARAGNRDRAGAVPGSRHEPPAPPPGDPRKKSRSVEIGRRAASRSPPSSLAGGATALGPPRRLVSCRTSSTPPSAAPSRGPRGADVRAPSAGEPPRSEASGRRRALPRARRLRDRVRPPAGFPGDPPGESAMTATALENETSELARRTRVLELFRRNLAALSPAEPGGFRPAAVPSRSPVEPSTAVPISVYGPRESPITREPDFETGLTLASPAGSPVIATAEGTVLQAGPISRRADARWRRLGLVVILSRRARSAGTSPAWPSGAAASRAARPSRVGTSGFARRRARHYDQRFEQPLGLARSTHLHSRPGLDRRRAAPAGPRPGARAPRSATDTSQQRGALRLLVVPDVGKQESLPAESRCSRRRRASGSRARAGGRREMPEARRAARMAQPARKAVGGTPACARSRASTRAFDLEGGGEAAARRGRRRERAGRTARRRHGTQRVGDTVVRVRAVQVRPPRRRRQARAQRGREENARSLGPSITCGRRPGSHPSPRRPRWAPAWCRQTEDDAAPRQRAPALDRCAEPVWNATKRTERGASWRRRALDIGHVARAVLRRRAGPRRPRPARPGEVRRELRRRRRQVARRNRKPDATNSARTTCSGRSRSRTRRPRARRPRRAGRPRSRTSSAPRIQSLQSSAPRMVRFSAYAASAAPARAGSGHTAA